MKRNKLYALSAALMVLGCAGCNNDEENLTGVENEGQTFEATFEGFNSNPGLKTTMIMQDKSMFDVWTPGDAIRVSDGTAFSKFVTDSEGRVRAKFQRLNSEAKLSEAAGTTYFAYYPADGCISYAGDSTFNVELPAVQHYDPNKTVAEGAWPMIGVSSSFKMPFYNVGSLVKIDYSSLTYTVIDSVVVESSEYNMSGTGTVSFENGEPRLRMDPVVGTPKSVKVDCGGMKVGPEGASVYVVLPPNTYHAGKLVIYTYMNALRAYMKQSADYTFSRSKYTEKVYAVPVNLGNGQNSEEGIVVD